MFGKSSSLSVVSASNAELIAEKNFRIREYHYDDIKRSSGFFAQLRSFHRHFTVEIYNPRFVKFKSDVSQDIKNITKSKLQFLLGVYFGSDHDAKMSAFINVFHYNKDCSWRHISIDDFSMIFDELIKNIDNFSASRDYHISFLNNILYYNYENSENSENTNSEALIRKALVSDVVKFIFRESLPDFSWHGEFVENYNSDKIRELDMIALANCALILLKMGDDIESIRLMALAVSKGNSINFKFEQANHLKFLYLLYLNRSGLKQICEYIIRTDNFIVVPFDTKSTDLEVFEVS